ncbi:hypothetical protein GTC050_01390 [Burkholderia pseudomallei]|nr:hypothetical protein GTC050_01390 [Burkholderia pseudomallei]
MGPQGPVAVCALAIPSPPPEHRQVRSCGSRLCPYGGRCDEQFSHEPYNQSFADGYAEFLHNDVFEAACVDDGPKAT